MKLTVVFIAALAVLAPALAEKNQLDRGEYPRFIEFPDGDGNLHWVDLEGEPDWSALNTLNRNPANNLYLLFTKRNPTSPQILEINNLDSVRSSNFDPRLPTVVIAHGWLSNQNTGLNVAIRDAYLSKFNVNVIVLDWRRLAMQNYVTAVFGVPDLGRALGQFLYFLNLNFGARLEQMHLVGFSLGAHLVGNAGRQLSGRIGRITGLDPAGPLWTLNSNSLRQSDAIYVEGIHTNGGLIGYGLGDECGHVDFHVNGGSTQPGCFTNVCSHNRAWDLFAATVAHDHLVGQKCSNSLQISLNSCRGAGHRLGNGEVSKWGTGIYRVNTAKNYPY